MTLIPIGNSSLLPHRACVLEDSTVRDADVYRILLLPYYRLSDIAVEPYQQRRRGVS